MASTKAATIRGIFLKPGLSKNRRLYTHENIGKAVQRMQGSIASGDGMPLNMATSHAAAFKDDATSTVGRITKVWQNSDGSASFEADVANTTAGRDVAALTVGKFIKGVSIRGSWAAEPKSIIHTDGEEAVTSDDLEISGVDFTNTPGVDGAEIQYAALAESYSANPSMIFESVEEVLLLSVEQDNEDAIRDAVEAAVENAVSAILEKDTSKPYGDVSYADPGYQKDKQKRYPIDSAKHVRAAWSYINQKDNASIYTAAQLARVKSRIKSAAKKFGINIVSEHEVIAADIQEILEAYASIALVNDSDSINITGYTNDPHQLRVVANRIAFGAIAAMHAIDPDDDGDIYLSKPDWSQVDATGDAGGMGPENEEGSVSNSANGNECEHCGAPDCPDEANYCHMCGKNIPSFANAAKAVECESCGTECHEKAIHCHMCGEPLPVSVTKNALGCGNCGATSPQDAMYCPTCGDPVPQAESSDLAPTEDKESEVTDEINTTDVPAEEAPLESAASLSLNTADLEAIAAMVIAGLKPVETAPEEVAAEVAPEEEEAPVADAPEEVAAEEVAAEESIESQENNVTENTFTAEQVAVMIAEAASKAATEAVAAAKKSAVESYRIGGDTFRKGLVGNSVGNDASDLSESEELDPTMLAEMSSTKFRQVQNEVWASTPFFAHKFAQSERGF